jgi:hypothetical protein
LYAAYYSPAKPHVVAAEGKVHLPSPDRHVSIEDLRRAKVDLSGTDPSSLIRSKTPPWYIPSWFGAAQQSGVSTIHYGNRWDLWLLLGFASRQNVSFKLEALQYGIQRVIFQGMVPPALPSFQIVAIQLPYGERLVITPVLARESYWDLSFSLSAVWGRSFWASFLASILTHFGPYFTPSSFSP